MKKGNNSISMQRLLNKDNHERKRILKRMYNGIESSQKTKKKKDDIRDPI